MNVLRLLLAAFAAAFTMTILSAQTYTRTPVTVWDSGVQQVTGGSGNKQKISLRIWQERVQHADGKHSWYLNYDVEARDKSFWGNWKYAYKLATITYSFTVAFGSNTGGATYSGTLQLNNVPASSGLLFDGGGVDPTLPPVITSATVTAARYGGSSGIAVTCTH